VASIDSAVLRSAFAAGAVLFATQAGASCGSAFCIINTNWDTQAAWSEQGQRLDLRYENIHQDRLRSGSRRISWEEKPRDHNEVQTVNHNWLANVDYTFDKDWAVNVSLPYAKKTHIHTEEDEMTGEQVPESWDFSKFGDVRAAARYRLATFEPGDHSLGTLGLNFGLKLPTGDFKQRNSDGELAERTLQPGSGTTDALLGIFYSQVLPAKNLSWFTQAQVQAPFNSRDGFKPGARLVLDAGLRYEVNDRVGLLLQANGLFRLRDSGAEADREDSGGKFFFLSPGVSVAATNDIRFYAFYQVPVYQYVNGVQLTSRPAAVLGVSGRF